MCRGRVSLLVFLFVLAVTLACGLTGPTLTPTEHVSAKATATERVPVTATPTQDISVFVNATLTALASRPLPTLVPPTTPIPSDTPVPTETLTPTIPPSPTLPPPTPTQQALRVAYVKNGNVWLWTQGGSTQPLTTAGYVVSLDLSGDGQMVAFQRETIPFHPELWAVNSDGTGERVLVSAADFLALLPGSPNPNAAGIGPFQYGWRPGTHILAYNTRLLFEGPGLGGNDDLRQVDADTLV